jgi:hypothetical protein
LLPPGGLLLRPKGERLPPKGLRLHVPERLPLREGLPLPLQRGLLPPGGLLLPPQGAPLPPGGGLRSDSLLLAVAMAAVL